MNLSEETLALWKRHLQKDVTTAGISTATGLNFTYLEAQAKNIYPVFYPVSASTPRVKPMFNGQRVGGQAVNWKAVTAIGNGGYPMVSEGNRNAFIKLTTRNYSSSYKYMGAEVKTSMQSQQTGLGFDDMVALGQLSLMNSLMNDQERMIMFGNSGPASVGGNGYALGVTGTPVLAQSNVSGASLPASAQNYVFAVALTPWGVNMAGQTGLALPFLRNNADSSQDLINGGTGVISAVSNSVVTDSTHKSINVTVPSSVGAVGYAFYLNQAANTTSGAYFVGVSSIPTFTITAAPSTSNQQANATDPVSGKGLTTDNSYNVLDFDGAMTWHFGTFGSAQPAYLQDLGGAGFTSGGDGTIAEFEAVADFLWTNYKASPDKIYVGGNLIQAATRAMVTSNAGANTASTGAVRIELDSAPGGGVSGGRLLRQYEWKYSVTGAPKPIPVVTHPWLPQGVVWFDITTNPYPAAGDSIPAVRRIVTLEDIFGITWPKTNLTYQNGVYAFQTMEHYLPFCGAILTGVANKVN